MVLNYAAAVNAELKDLFAAGADIVQIDEPYMQARPDKARQYGLRGLDAALDGVTGTTAIHICFGYAALSSTCGRRVIHSWPNWRFSPFKMNHSERTCPGALCF